MEACVQARQVLQANISLAIPQVGIEAVELPDSSDILGAFMFGIGDAVAGVNGPPSLPTQQILVANGEVEFIGNLNATEYDAFIELADIDHFGISKSQGFGNAGDEETLQEEGGFQFFGNFVPVANRSQAESTQLVSEVGVAALNSMLCGPRGEVEKVPEYVIEADGDVSELASWLSWIRTDMK
jgi:hypothetical protein